MKKRRRNSGNLYVISAPSGAGKTSLCKHLVGTLPGLKFSVSLTTRGPRPDEQHGVDYEFVSREEFESMISRQGFIEWARVHGELYGTPRGKLEELISEGNDVILDIDTQGAMQIRKQLKSGIYVFILPPSLEVLRDRLLKRKTEPEEIIRKRLSAAITEIKTYGEYDYVIINDIFDHALRELESVIVAQRARTDMIDSRWIDETFCEGRNSNGYHFSADRI